MLNLLNNNDKKMRPTGRESLFNKDYMDLKSTVFSTIDWSGVRWSWVNFQCPAWGVLQFG